MQRFHPPRLNWARFAAIVGVMAMCGLAPTVVTVRDRFQDNSINPARWWVTDLGELAITETNQRLQISSGGLPNFGPFVWIEIREWGANWRHDFTVELDYNLSIDTPQGDRWVALGPSFGVKHRSMFSARIMRDSSGLHLVATRFNNDGTSESDSLPISQASGRMRIHWQRDHDRVAITAAGRTLVIRDLWPRFGPAHGHKPMVISLHGAASSLTNINGNKAWMDNFEFTGDQTAR